MENKTHGMKYKCAIGGNMCPFICYKEEEVGVKSYIAHK
jgi:hypothetical protein